jgi:hypothetical protein
LTGLEVYLLFPLAKNKVDPPPINKETQQKSFRVYMMGSPAAAYDHALQPMNRSDAASTRSILPGNALEYTGPAYIQ